MKTVKELIQWFNEKLNFIIENGYTDLDFNITDTELEEAIDILQIHEKELAEKDKYIETLKKMIAKMDKQTLYKEDFINDCRFHYDIFPCVCENKNYWLKDNSDYDKLPSKEELK